MKKNRFPIPRAFWWRFPALLTLLGLWLGHPAVAQPVIFDFDNATPALTTGQNLPFDQAAGGITAHFNVAVGNFSVQNNSSTFLALSLFSGNYLYPNGSFGILVVQFSQPITNLILNFATAEQTPIELPTPIQLIAYANSTNTSPVGAITNAGTYFGLNSLPMGTLTFGAATPFDLVTVNIQPGGATGFMLDNLAVQLLVGIRYVIATSAAPAAGGSTSGGGSYDLGTNATVVATANPGYGFVNWTEGGVEVSPLASYDFTATGDRTLVANFVQTHTIATSASPGSGGTISGDGVYPTGSDASVLATARPGYAFVNWTENGVPVSTRPGWFFTVGADRTLVANFASTCTITTSSAQGSSCAISGGGTYAIGSSATVVATPKSGSSFVNWTEGDAMVSTAASYRFAASTNRTLVANVTPDHQTVTFDFDTGAPLATLGQTTPLDQTSGGLTAHFGSTNDPAFSVQTDVHTAWTLPLFSGNYLSPDLSPSLMQIQFSQPVVSLALTFATFDLQNLVAPTTLQLTAYASPAGTSPVGSASAQGIFDPRASFPMGTLNFSSTTPFREVRLALTPIPGGATDFSVDNVSVTTIPTLQVLRTSTNTVLVSWAAPSPGYRLQENSAPASAGWADTPTNTISVAGGQNLVVETPSAGNRFFRLYHP